VLGGKVDPSRGERGKHRVLEESDCKNELDLIVPAVGEIC